MGQKRILQPVESAIDDVDMSNMICTYIPTTWTSSRPPTAVIVELTREIEGDIEGDITREMEITG